MNLQSLVHLALPAVVLDFSEDIRAIIEQFYVLNSNEALAQAFLTKCIYLRIQRAVVLHQPGQTFQRFACACAIFPPHP
jgi:hypothetical protein